MMINLFAFSILNYTIHLLPNCVSLCAYRLSTLFSMSVPASNTWNNIFAPDPVPDIHSVPAAQFQPVHY